MSGQRFSIRDIEDQLKDLQVNSSPSGSRISLFTLLLFQHGSEPEEHAALAIEGIFGRRPGRIVYVHSESGTERDDTQARVYARCFNENDNQGVCFQEIEVVPGKEMQSDSITPLIPLCVRDMPVICYWANHDLPDASHRKALEHAVDLIILPPLRSQGDLAASYALWLKRMEIFSGMKTPFAEMTWTKSSELRKYIAGVMTKISTAHIPQLLMTASGFNDDEIVLMVIWIAGRIDIPNITWERTSVHLSSASSRIRIDTVPGQRKMTFSASGKTAVIEFMHGTVRTEIDGTVIEYPRKGSGDPDALIWNIDHPGSDSLYNDSIQQEVKRVGKKQRDM